MLINKKLHKYSNINSFHINIFIYFIKRQILGSVELTLNFFL